MGKLGWTEYEYYTCSPEGFYYASQGYYAKIQDESLAVRNLAFITYRLGGGKETIDNIWPLNGKEKDTIKPLTREQWDRIKGRQITVDQSIAKARLKKKK